MVLGRSFWRFWAAAALVNVGDGIRMAAFPLLAVSLSAGPAGVSIVAAAGAAPWVVAGLAAGALADRRNARRLLVAADSLRVAVLAGLIVAVLTDRASVPLVASAAFALGLGECVRDTTAQIVIPRLVPAVMIERANGRLVAAEVVGNEFAGPLIGASLFAAGVALPFLANGAALAIAVLLVLSIPAAVLLRGTPPSDTDQVAAGVRAGLGWLGRHQTLRALVVAGALIQLADSAWFAIFVLFSNDRLGLGPLGFGVLLATGAAGGLLGSLVADRMIGRHRHHPVLLAAMLATAAPPLLLLFAPARWAAVLVVAVTSAAFGVFNVAAVSLRHRLVPEQLLGRVVAAWRTALMAAAGVGALAGGVIATTRGLDAPFLLSAALGACALAVWWSAPRPAPPSLAE